MTPDALPEPRPRAVLRAWWPAAGAALVVFAAATVTRADADLWGHLRFGLDILRDHRLASIDPYSFTQDLLWLNHEWLSEVQMAIAYTAGGVVGLALLKAILACVTLGIIWKSLDGASLAARVVVLVLVVFGTIHMTSTLRPQLWTFASMAILCWALVNPYSRWRRALPLVFALWANLHGGFVVGLGVLGVWAAMDVVTRPATAKHWVVIVSASVLATLVTPYGWTLWEFIARTVRMTRDIDEWRSLWGTPFLNWVPWFAGVAATIWAASRRSIVWLPAIAVLAMLAWSSARVMRIESIFVESSAILLSPLIVRRWPARLASLPKERSNAEPIVALAMFAALGAGAGWIASKSLPCLPILGDWAPDLESVHLFGANASGRLVTSFNWGEYALWHLGPRVRVSMDGRRETIYSDARIAENDAIVAGTPLGLETLARWNAEYVWLPSTSVVTKNWLVRHGYRLALDGSRSFLAVRGDLPMLQLLAGQQTPGWRPCFPG
jgi:hypothetical protein